MVPWNPKANDVFLQAAEIDALEDRCLFLDHQCGDDSALREQVESLLSASSRAGSFLNRPAVSATTDHEPIRERPGTVIGPYKLMEQIGEGGMGLVFVAEQQQPVRRKVALKLIKPGMDSKQVIARFEAERQALALMDHQNIAKVFDAGATDSGRPFFVMELVHGIPITDYCNANKLTPRERLGLFIPVCQAIQHAHQKGIIHRDIKPSNVLVTMYDDKPVPKVIDFGVAKAIEQHLTERTVYTQFGTMVGTFEYMSPEQAEMNAFGVDTRSDVYSLGVLLYELLTGTTPLERKRLREAAYGDIVRLIKEEEPPRPSVRLSTSGALAKVAAACKTDPAKLSRLVRGELDWVVMRCLEKDRSRRYETANGLARDVERYLKDEPVEACPPSIVYKLQKLFRRNKAAVVTTAVVAAALVLGTVVSTWQAIQATRSERLAADRLVELQEERDRANSERDKATQAEKDAKDQAGIARAVNDFLQNDLLAQASPNKEPDRDLKLRTLLDRAAQKIEGKFDQQPLIEASIRYTLGETYMALTLFAAAQVQLERALELRHRNLGEEHPLTLKSMCRLATSLREQNKYAEAEALYRKTLELQCRVLGEEDLATVGTMDGLAYLLQARGKLAEAEPLYRKVVAIRRRVLGEEDSRTLESMSKLAQVLQRQGKLSAAEAESSQRKVLEARRRELGKEHPDTLLSADNLAYQLLGQGKLDEAERLSLWGLETARRVLGEEHGRTLMSMANLGRALHARGDYAAAEPLLIKCLEVRRRVNGEEHHLTLHVVGYLAELYQDQGKFDHAEPLRVERVALARRGLGTEHPEFTLALASLGLCRLQQQKFAEAEPLLRECLAIRERKEPDVWTTFNTKSLLGGALLGQKKHAEAEPLLLAGYEGLKQRESTIPPQWRDRPTTALQSLVQLYVAWAKPDEAVKWRKEQEARKAEEKKP